MATSINRKMPAGTKRMTIGCQYCAVGCGYNALLVPEDTSKGEPETEVGVSMFITPAMQPPGEGTIKYKGKTMKTSVSPDPRCDLNKGNHSVRGGSQGQNLVTANGKGRSTEDRLKSPQIRLADEKFHDITWETLNQVMAKLVIEATKIKSVGEENSPKLQVTNPEHLGVKLYEYQYLENTFAATKLFFSCLGTPNAAYHDRPSVAGSSPGMKDVGFSPHDFSYDEVRDSDVLVFIGTNPYENQSVFFMQYCVGKEMIVIDPRYTATAQYAVETGGLHLQPTSLGADSLVLYAIAREIIQSWLNNGGTLSDFPKSSNLATKKDVSSLLDKDSDKSQVRRRASRAADFVDFATNFLLVNKEVSPYTLEKASAVSGIPRASLRNAVSKLFKPTERNQASQPKVGIFYEKGMIWGFNYHNTASVGSLGLLLRAYSEPGRFVGRVGGHQKGWAESRQAVPIFKNSTTEGYPFRNAKDTYTDTPLKELKKHKNVDEETIKVHHNLDMHVFGPTDRDMPPGLTGTRVNLFNGVNTKRNPDVRLLWIIGNNYFGQTNDSQTKAKKLNDRLKIGGTDGKILRPANSEVSEIVTTLTQRMEEGGIVLIHQDIFPNPTTTLCDIIIPAAGWGEDNFCRYNAQRRLRLFERFQDMPLHNNDKYISGDPMLQLNTFLHSPKPDWVIFRDIARAIGKEIDGTPEKGFFEKELENIFPWKNSSELADEMAQRSNRSSGLGLTHLYTFAEHRGITNKRIHTILGLGGRGFAEHLGKDQDGKRLYSIIDESEVYGNGIATNGVLLPLRLETAKDDPKKLRLLGTLRNVKSNTLFFIKAPWEERKPDFERINKKSNNSNELFVTNGRFNHLWNNMFHHLRNEYTSERYPEDLPGTILELNPKWAGDAERQIENGQIVKVKKGENQEFLAVASLQDSVPEGGAFAMFSYPVFDKQEGTFNFKGYPNNITDHYWDGINPIGAVKYARAIVTKAPNPDGGGIWKYETTKRQGPTFEMRNHLRPETPLESRPGGNKISRKDWEMRELIVTKGLPRAGLRRKFKFPWDEVHGVTNIRNLQEDKSQGTGRFWHEIENLTPKEFLNMKIDASFHGEKPVSISEGLILWLTKFMPGGMLDAGRKSLPIPDFDLKRITKIKHILSEPQKFTKAKLEEIKSLLDDLIDRPHRVVEEYFYSPDNFLILLKFNANVRKRFTQRLSERRGMIWKEGNNIVDTWNPNELDIAHTWTKSVEASTNIPPTTNATKSFARDIRPLFREVDIEGMRFMFDLSRYEDVRDHSAIILERLKDKEDPMPPVEHGGPWSSEDIAKFELWVQEGHPK